MTTSFPEKMFIPLSGATFPVAACSFRPSKNVRNTKPSIGIIYFPPNKHPKSQTVCRHSHNQWFGGCSDVITFGSHVLVLWRPSSEELDIEPRLNSPALCSCLHTMNNEHHITITASVYGEQSLSVILFFEVAKVWTGINHTLVAWNRQVPHKPNASTKNPGSRRAEVETTEPLHKCSFFELLPKSPQCVTVLQLSSCLRYLLHTCAPKLGTFHQ